MRAPILTYCVIAYSITWGVGFSIFSLFEQGLLSPQERDLYHNLAAFGPAIAACVTTLIFYRKNGLHLLGARLAPQPVSGLAVTITLAPLFLLGVGWMILGAFTGEWYSFRRFYSKNLQSNAEVWAYWLPLFSYAFLEEIGWRGFLLPHLQERFSAWVANLWLAGIWILWHLPFFFYRFDFSPAIAVGFFFGIFVGAIILTSLFNTSNGLLWPVILFHFLNNFGSTFDNDLFVSVLSSGFVVIAVFLVFRFKQENLSPIPRTGNYFKARQ